MLFLEFVVRGSVLVDRGAEGVELLEGLKRGSVVDVELWLDELLEFIA